jgi:hypothetical protein
MDFFDEDLEIYSRTLFLIVLSSLIANIVSILDEARLLNNFSLCNEIQLSSEILRKIAAVTYFVAYISQFTSPIDAQLNHDYGLEDQLKVC